jgi:hypothetical protein
VLDVCYWHLADVPLTLTNNEADVMLCPLMTLSEHHADPLLTCRLAANVVITRLANPTAKASSLMLVAVRATRNSALLGVLELGTSL